jgi:putative tricarboxylic transport membrane protein
MEGQEGRAAARQKSAEIVVAALFFLVGALVIYDSVRLGWTWGADGPKPGYFPFYLGLIICLSSAINILRAALSSEDKDKSFVEVGQLKMVLAVLVPTAVYVMLVTWIGIYVASTVFIAFFMRWLGKYRWWKVAVVSVATMVAFFLIFELWFQVPLPKGPVESFLKLD